MKQLSMIAVAAALFLGGYVNVEAQQRVKMGHLSKAVTSAGTPERVVSTNLFVTTATFVGINQFKANSTSTNWVGAISGNEAQWLPVEPGIAGALTITAPPGKSYNLYDIYIDTGSDGDEITISYFY